jgi:glycosyltransferase involved in cell wall biosynthesis
MNSTAVVTIVSNNYLHFARTLMQSVSEKHPEADRYCVIVDRDLTHAAALTSEFQTIKLSELDLPDGDDFLFQYNVLELNTAVKPWALAHLIQRGYQNILYIDPDIVLYSPLHEVFAAFDAGSEVVLTPHLLAPVTDTLNPGELDIRRAGTYNLGFCALRNSANTRAMLTWWQTKLQRHCVVAHDQGIFVDQSWIDLVPGLFNHVYILRHPGYNVAYWNLTQRPVTEHEGRYEVAGHVLAFFHYSGLNPASPDSVSKYQNRFTLGNVGESVAKLIADYCQRVAGNGLAHYKSLPYGFGYFDDATAITDADRTRFRTHDALRGHALGQPFASRALLSNVQSHALQETERTLHRIYAHFLGREPDASGRQTFARRLATAPGRLQAVIDIGTSKEAKAKPGWLLRLLSWPLQHAQLATYSPPTPLTVALAGKHHDRPAPYGGLHAPDPDVADNGIWVSPRLDLPVCAMPLGHINITGSIDLGLLARGRMRGDFVLTIHGPAGELHSAQLRQSGIFSIDLTVPVHSFLSGNQWSILASASVVPKDIGMGADTRCLSWRVRTITVDGVALIDMARSPSTARLEDINAAGGINLIGYLRAELGLGEAARSLAKACVAAHIPFSAVDVGYQSSNLQRDTSVLPNAVTERFPIDLMYVNADQVATTASFLRGKNHTARYRIGYWHWEQPQLPPSALGAFAHLDEVWVPSTFVHDAVAPYSPVPVVKIPHAIDFSPSEGAKRSQFGLPEDKLLALVMYDFHSYQYRKNPQAALAAFRKAAAHRQDAALVIKTMNGQHHAAAYQALQQSVQDLPQVIFIDQFFTRQQTWDLQACCDILISLHRAEGFGLAPAEMMYLGKPVIATGWSANTDFMNSENSCPVRFRLDALQQAVGVYPAGQLWAEADIDHAAWFLTGLLDNPALRQRLGQQASADIRRQLSPQAVGALVSQRLSLLGFWHKSLQLAK